LSVRCKEDFGPKTAFSQRRPKRGASGIVGEEKRRKNPGTGPQVHRKSSRNSVKVEVQKATVGREDKKGKYALCEGIFISATSQGATRKQNQAPRHRKKKNRKESERLSGAMGS